ncbi:hypothetical protein ATANTOWER_020013 [Ataeniobius toweri]|uniref:Secreted protein n=1 Tax=Ataeniobius toweri TaxID=208326 RepID=A0ABU7BD07_9TELE|nr:hypothetical protein [Ataeniobius toweri]
MGPFSTLPLYFYLLVFIVLHYFLLATTCSMSVTCLCFDFARQSGATEMSKFLHLKSISPGLLRRLTGTMRPSVPRPGLWQRQKLRPGRSSVRPCRRTTQVGLKTILANRTVPQAEEAVLRQHCLQ